MEQRRRSRAGEGCGLAKVAPLLALVNDWRAFLAAGTEDREVDIFRRHERTGRPLGAKDFVTTLEGTLGRTLHPQSPGRKKKV